MAHQLGVGPVDDAYEAFKALALKSAADRAATRKINQESYDSCVMELALVAVTVRGNDAFDFEVAVPVRRCRYGSGMGTHSDQCGVIFAKTLRAELANIDFIPRSPHLGMPRTPDMGFVPPNDCLG